jgi:hypothetical protein
MPHQFPPPWSVEETDACFFVYNDHWQVDAFGVFLK